MEQSNLQSKPSYRCEVISGYESLANTKDNINYSISVLVTGVHCAACIQKIESRLLAQEGVTAARLNFSTNRLNIGWQGSAEKVNRLLQQVYNLGYSITPYNQEAYNSEIEREDRFLLLNLGIAGFAMGNIMLLSFGLWLAGDGSMGIETRDLMHWVQALIAIPTIFFAGRPFFRSAAKVLRHGKTNMDVPISLAFILATSMSLYETFHHGQHAYFDSAVMLCFFLLIGRYLDFRARKKARSYATDLLSTLEGFALVIQDGKQSNVLIRDLKEGMIVQVSAGEKFPIDGMINQGETEVDTSLVTGETVPRFVREGEMVYAGTLNMGMPVTIQVAKASDDSLLAEIVKLMEKAEQGQSRYVRLADRAAKLYTPIVHSVALISFLGWTILDGIEWQSALMISITVLIITCPCALALAVPVVQVVATGILMKRRILVKSGDALEKLATIDTVFFDKTGTLTIGKPELVDCDDSSLLPLAASIASYSKHPLSVALTQAYNAEMYLMTDVEEIAGKGLQAKWQGLTVKLGSKSFCNISISSNRALTELWLIVEGKKPCCFYFEDRLREDAQEVVEYFKKNKIHVVMVSGDLSAVAQKIAKACHIDEVYSELSPVEKFYKLEDAKQRGQKVLMVGDGLNDTAILAGADASIAPSTAIDMSQNVADIIFMEKNLRPVLVTHWIAVMSSRLVKQNFALSVIYNILAIPVAVLGYVTPLVAAIAMSGSSLLVIANSFRLRWSQ